MTCLDFYFKNEEDFAKFSKFFEDCELSEYLNLEKFAVENGHIGATIDPKSTFIASWFNDGFDEIEPPTDDEVAAMILFREELDRVHPQILYS
ncbi:MAG TPA: hypothetical protein PKA42_03895 [Candidatus Paceibacterota bacterium]|nr:hypothetical protein [Candidatus Paceibacterota bacterium]